MAELAYDRHAFETDGLVVEVKKLIMLETLVAHAYHAIDDAIDDHDTRAQLRTFGRTHERNARALTRCLCWQAATGDSPEPQTSTEGVVGGLSPIMAMWHNEDEAARGYEELLERPIREPHLERALTRGLEDARKHWAWLALQAHPLARHQARA
ncbi:MAG TPA: hypothetical protein VFB62_17685 [Polyangiaceae bacterium]|nr:hypothetical protein [Polyangiaceae bacterium]